MRVDICEQNSRVNFYCSHLKHSLSIDCAHIIGLMFCIFTRELTSIGAKAIQPTAGYYFMPDFEVCRAGFKKRGFETGAQMCAAMLEECDVAVSIITVHLILRSLVQIRHTTTGTKRLFFSLSMTIS